jgi:hypothetical protein
VLFAGADNVTPLCNSSNHYTTTGVVDNCLTTYIPVNIFALAPFINLTLPRWRPTVNEDADWKYQHRIFITLMLNHHL